MGEYLNQTPRWKNNPLTFLANYQLFKLQPQKAWLSHRSPEVGLQVTLGYQHSLLVASTDSAWLGRLRA